MSVTIYFAEYAWLPSGWARAVRFTVDAEGWLTQVSADAAAGDAIRLGRYVLPGMPNLHSHAFQRAMAGLAEHRAEGEDSFWTWREAMYALASALTPERMHSIALGLYRDMLEAGYTSVCEFHYLHHRPDGSAYAPASAMSDALIAAADEAGIGLTLLPTLYQVGGFDGRPPSARQRRFVHDVDAFLRLVETLRPRSGADCAIGIALHSLRAVPEQALLEVLGSEVAGAGPIHIHVAEQLAEVDDCLHLRGTRPVRWLIDQVAPDPRWCLVHATHVTPSEIEAMAQAGIVVGLCPTTEANLGDGLFPLAPYLAAGGAIGIGSDSQVSIDPFEELRWLEYGQRLASLRRNIAASAASTSCGETLWRAALTGGAQASGRRVGALAPGHRADWIVLEDRSGVFADKPLERLLDVAIFAADRRAVREVYVAGRRVVAGGRHQARTS
jgi:formimidoylglutamate deiminase